jgi:hypothetical protein
MDAFKELAKQLGGKIHSQNLSNWNIGNSHRCITVKNYAGFRLEIDDYINVWEIIIKAESNFGCSINIPDKIWGWTKPYELSGFRYKTYFSEDRNPFSGTEARNFWNQFALKINELNFSEAEGVFFHSYTGLVLKPERNIISILDDFIKLLAENSESFWTDSKERIYAKNIPESLRLLIPLLKKWSIPDDSEREQLMDETSDRQKKNLVKKVSPYMAEINAFLDSFGDEAQSYEAMLLGNLAELVSEIWAD